MRPIIGLTPSNYLDNSDTHTNINNDYVKAVLEAGGIPLVMPITLDAEVAEGYLGAVDGLILTGGGDVLPSYYGEEPAKGLKSVCGDRDEYEMMLFKKAYGMNMPVMGICRGCQVINVALGGTLYQDIDSQLKDSNGHYQQGAGHELYHSVSIGPDTALYDILNEKTIYVNSFHHQAINQLSGDLTVSAWAKDGIVEAVEASGKAFVMGVQWHPEEMISRHRVFLRLFEALIAKGAEFGKRK